MTHNFHVTYVSEKINKIRWRQDPFNNAHFFVTGSVDNDENTIKLWDLFENEEEDDIYPFLVSSYNYSGDVTEIKFLNEDFFVTTSSSGAADLFHIESPYGADSMIRNKIHWPELHTFNNGDPSPCTALDVYESDIVTIGENGSINLLTSQSQNVIRTIENADSSSLQCVTFFKHNQILTSNLRGQLKIWDLQSNDNKPLATFMLSGDLVTPTCLTFHPTQRHLVVAGDELGALTTWDLRQNTFPINVLNAHEGAISEIQFHPDHPDQLFSCSSSGEVWHWSAKNKGQSIGLEVSENVWLTPDNVKNKLEVFTLMPTLGKPVNSLDLNRSKVLCGCDNEAIYLLNNVNLY